MVYKEYMNKDNERHEEKSNEDYQDAEEKTLQTMQYHTKKLI